jgi:hypothetical protein
MQLPGLGGVGINRSTARLLVLANFYILFLVLGAAIFSAIEGPQEAQCVKLLRQLRKDFLLDHKCVRGEYCPLCFNTDCVCVTPWDLLLQLFLKAHKYWVSGLRPSSGILNTTKHNV